ncbi:MAG: hypothetical protein QXD78_01770 [Candidatus Bathyarchaeia archaeon]
MVKIGFIILVNGTIGASWTKTGKTGIIGSENVFGCHGSYSRIMAIESKAKFNGLVIIGN